MNLKDMLAIGIPALLGVATVVSYIDDVRSNIAIEAAVAVATEEEAVVDPTTSTTK